MKNAEWLDSPHELERRLKLGVDHLREVRESMEELARIADAIGPLLGVSRAPVRSTSAPRPRPARKPAGARAQEARAATTPPSASGARVPPSNAPSAPAAPEAQDELPEWRRMFPELSAEIPGHFKGTGRPS